ncbi:hypothetical protein [Frigoribacterium sp. PvP032]|uniref:hypothetical protein n=1 Tax=Frigoribacterium sp. PvP032 TaxID=2806589 RepID=UPI001AE4B87C|nr:hypothetical protein [Frigoribacterium sp. PvP032]MBP1190644.1 hypothetical protein [Frigoribacterium sp. PvP032]
MSPFAMLGDADALACEGDSCLLPAVVATVGALTPSGPPTADPIDADPAQEAAVSR